MKYIYIYSCFFFNLLSSVCVSQEIGKFEESVNFNGVNHSLSYYVPEDYNEDMDYPVFVAIHGCGGNSFSFRDDLIAFSDIIDAIIICPDFKGEQLTGANGQLINDAISLTLNLGYSIDTSGVYLSGFSCNGQEAYIHGWNEIYDFAGIIPFNSWIPFIDSQYNTSSSIPTCVCIGTNDGSYSNNISLFEDFISSGGNGYLNEMQGIGHEWNFSTRDSELIECFDWLNSLETTSIVNDDLIDENKYLLYPNPVVDRNFYVSNFESEKLYIEIFDSFGNLILNINSNESPVRIEMQSMNTTVVFLKIFNSSKQVTTRKVIFENQ